MTWKIVEIDAVNSLKLIKTELFTNMRANCNYLWTLNAEELAHPRNFSLVYWRKQLPEVQWHPQNFQCMQTHRHWWQQPRRAPHNPHQSQGWPGRGVWEEDWTPDRYKCGHRPPSRSMMCLQAPATITCIPWYIPVQVTLDISGSPTETKWGLRKYPG